MYYDLGPESCTCAGNCSPGSDCPRYMEFWNNVFPQYDAQADGSMPLLAPPGIDTGMGLERLALIVQGLKYKEVAAKLFLSERTIKYHMGQILERLHLKNRAQAVEYARRAGFAG